MDPYTEQRLIEEVRYLHSLWHQGPPSNPDQRSAHLPNPNLRKTHQPNHTQLKPVKKKIKKKGKRNGKKLSASSDLEWPVHEVNVVQMSSSGWPVFKPAKPKPVFVPNPEEKARLDAIRIQQEALKVSQKFFAGNEDSDGGIDSDEDSDEDDDDDDDMMDEDKNSLDSFFEKVFEEDGELRDYYKKNNENGEFSCLVCGGIWEKVGKKFKNCVALVQHSLTIAKTKKKKAHRAYAQVMCKVLGWDINRLPSMPMLSNNKSDEAKIDELPSSIVPEALTGDQATHGEGNVDIKIENTSMGNIDSVVSDVGDGEANAKEQASQFLDVDSCIIPGITDNVNGDMMLCESSLKVEESDKCAENTETIVSGGDGNSSGVVNHLCKNVENLTVLEKSREPSMGSCCQLV